MKRSTQVSLVLMTVTGIGAGAYALAQDNGCRQTDPNAVRRDPPPDCRSHGGHGSSGGGHGLFSSSSSSSGTPTASTSSTSHGGFGSIGHALSGGG